MTFLEQQIADYINKNKWITGYFNINHCMECGKLSAIITKIDFNDGYFKVTSTCPNCKTEMYFKFELGKSNLDSWFPYKEKENIED